MATISKNNIGTGNTIQAEHITRIIDALNGTGSADIIATGSFTGSFNGSADTWIVQDLTVNGTASINYFETIYETSSIIYQSGSTKFGNSADDTHQFTGSVFIEGNTEFNGSVTGSVFTGSFQGDGSGLTGLVSSSYAVTASYADNALSAINTPNAVITASNTGNDDTIEFLKGGGGAFAVTVNNVVSSSYALTASYALSSPAGTDTNFANTNLSLTGTRFHDLNGFDLTIAGGNAGIYLDEATNTSQFGQGSNYIQVDNTGIILYHGLANRVSTIAGSTVINEAGGNVDLRVESDTNPNMLLVDAGLNRVGIGKSAPNSVLDVNGDTIVSGSLTVKGTAIPSTGETLQSWYVSDSTALVSLINATTINGTFVPTIKATQPAADNYTPLAYINEIGADTGTFPGLIFQVRSGSNAAVQNRDLFAFRNYTTDIVNIGTGLVDINNDTTITGSLTVTGTASYLKSVVSASSAGAVTVVMTEATYPSGQVIRLDPHDGTFTMQYTLPTLKAGLHYTFTSITAATDGTGGIVRFIGPASQTLCGIVSCTDGTKQITVNAVQNSVATMSFADGDFRNGSRLNFICDGEQWNVSGTTNCTTSEITVAS